MASRRKIDEYIHAGRITVNGVVAIPGTKANPQTDDIRLDNQPLPTTTEALQYIMLHKPAGYITTAGDTHGRPTVFDLLPSGARVLAWGGWTWTPAGCYCSPTTAILPTA